MEFHWFEDGFEANPYYNCCIGLYNTSAAFKRGLKSIYSDCSYFVSVGTLEKGYKIFAHYVTGEVREIRLGINELTGREIRETHNLERLLLNGEFGELISLKLED